MPKNFNLQPLFMSWIKSTTLFKVGKILTTVILFGFNIHDIIHSWDRQEKPVWVWDIFTIYRDAFKGGHDVSNVKKIIISQNIFITIEIMSHILQKH